MSKVLSRKQVWAAPFAIGLVSLVGLVAALLADGLGDVISWAALAVPTALSFWGLWFAGRRQLRQCDRIRRPGRELPSRPPGLTDVGNHGA